MLLRTLRTGALALAACVALAPHVRADTELVVAEPVHSIGYLPLYVAIRNGYFAAEKIKVKVLTTEGGGAHTNAVLTKRAFAFIGGPEHDAFAKAKGAELRSVVNIVDRGNVYLVAAKTLPPPTKPYGDYVKGKKIVVSYYGGTPNSIIRYLLRKWGLDAKKDVTLIETGNAAVLAALATKQGDIGVTTEPLLTQGIAKGIWGEPFFNVPKELGPYAYSTINVRKESIDTEPEVVKGFVHAMIKGLHFTYQNHEAAAEIAKKEFPTMPLDQLQATLKRSFDDEMWSKDGMVSRASWDTAKSVVMDAGILTKDIGYDEIIDMQFVRTSVSAR